MNKTEKFNELHKHIGWEQVSDIHQIDAECEMPASSGTLLAKLLIENAENQTGISLEEDEHCELVDELVKIYS